MDTLMGAAKLEQQKQQVQRELGELRARHKGRKGVYGGDDGRLKKKLDTQLVLLGRKILLDEQDGLAPPPQLSKAQILAAAAESEEVARRVSPPMQPPSGRWVMCARCAHTHAGRERDVLRVTPACTLS
jgi:hypothetical protein